MASLDDLIDRLAVVFVRLHDLADVDTANELADMDLAFSQARIVWLLGTAPTPLAIHEIAERMNLTLPSAGRNVDRLVRLGFVERRESADDRRVKLVELSPTGRALFARKLEHFRSAFTALLAPLSGADHDRLFDALAPLTSDQSACAIARDPKGTA